MAFRLLACDLDGTLMGDDMVISSRVRQAVTAVQERGINVTLATGRGFAAARPFAQLLNITTPIICYQGGVVQDPVNGDQLYRATMDPALAQAVIKLAHRLDWHLVLYVQDCVYVEEFQHPRTFYTSLLGLNIQRVPNLAHVTATSSSPPDKLLIVAAEEEAKRVHAEMVAHFDGQMNIVRSHSLFIEGNPLDADKGNALCQLAAHLDVPQAQVIAIGDQGNDVPMLTWAGLGIAMGSGSAEAQAAADWIAPPLSADGAAVAMERFLLTQR